MSLTEVQIYDESSWNEIAKIDSNPYAFAKVCVTSLAVARGFSRQSIQCSEQESNANKFLNQLPEAERFDLVFLNPTTVLGPLLTRELRSTSEIVYHLMAGNLPLVPHWGTGGAPHRSLHTRTFGSVTHAMRSRGCARRGACCGGSTRAAQRTGSVHSQWPQHLARRLGQGTRCPLPDVCRMLHVMMFVFALPYLLPRSHRIVRYNVGTRVAPTLLTLALPMLDSKLSFNYLWSNVRHSAAPHLVLTSSLTVRLDRLLRYRPLQGGAGHGVRASF